MLIIFSILMRARNNVALQVILLLLCCHSALPQGEVAPPRPQKRIVTRTRLVAIFSELENQLFQALQKKEHTSLDGLLSDDFQVWTPAPPGDPIPGDDWRNQALAENLKAFQIRQMAARGLDENTVIVNFVLNKKVETGSGSATRNYFVVDLWQRSGDTWKLGDRYASPLAGTASQPVRVRPSGKN